MLATPQRSEGSAGPLLKHPDSRDIFVSIHPAANSYGAPVPTQEQGTVNTVLGPVPDSELGVVAVHEALLSVLPGAQYAPDITMDRAEIFETLAAKLKEFRDHGGQTIVDSTGMFHGRDLKLYEA